MKTVALILGVFFISVTAKAQETASTTVTVTIENVMSNEGVILASLHNSDTFMKGAGLIDLTDQAKKGEMTLTFENVQPGSYAIMVLHDKNENNRMDFQANGMPKENYGMSNNEMTMGPPTFADAKFEVAGEDMALTIRF